MDMWVRLIAFVGLMLPTLATSQQTDSQCPRVMSKNERAALLQGRDMRQMEREGYPSDPYVLYQRAKEIGNMRDAWGAVTMALDGVGAKRDLGKADDLWKDYWCSQVLPAFEDKREYAFSTLKAAAGRGFPSAMIRLSEAYRKGEFGQAADLRLSEEWKAKYDAARAKQH